MTQKIETKKNMTISGKLRINNLWVPTTKFTKAMIQDLLLQMFFSHHCEFGKKGKRRNFYPSLLIGYYSQIWETDMVSILTFCDQWSHISTAVSRENEVFQPFTVPSSLYSSRFSAGALLTKDRLTREEQTHLLTCTSHIHLGKMQG